MNKNLPVSFWQILFFLSYSLIVHVNGAVAQGLSGFPDKTVFTENKGQWLDAAGRLCPDLFYKATLPGMDIYLGKKKISYVLRKELPANPIVGQASQNGEDSKVASRLETHVVSLELLGANSDVVITPKEQLEGYTNYYYPHCPNGIHQVRSYKKIIYNNIYDNIDMECVLPEGDPAVGVRTSSTSNNFKYNFILHPGADPAVIQLRYEGGSVTRLVQQKIPGINILTPLGILSETIPAIYQSHKAGQINSKIVPIGGDYLLTNNTIAFTIGQYDKSRDLILDPWATYYGGSSDDVANAIVVDPASNVLVTGYSISTDFPTGATAGNTTYQATRVGNYDILIVKTNADGVRLWATLYGGTSAAAPVGNGAFQYGTSIATDADGNVVVGGASRASNFPVSVGAFQAAYKGGANEGDGVVIKLDATGARLWATFYGGTSDDLVSGVAIDAAGDIAITGGTVGANSTFPVVSPYQNANAGSWDAFLAKLLGSTGVPTFSTYYGGANFDRAFGVGVDQQGDILIAGETRGAFPTTAGVYQPNFGGGGDDAFLVKFKGVTDVNGTAGNRLWSTYLGGNGGDNGYGVISRREAGIDNIYVCGRTGSAGLGTAGVLQEAKNINTQDGFVTKFNPAGSRLWYTYLGGTNLDIVGDLALHPDGDIVVTGNTASSDFPVTANALQTTYGGGISDAFFAKISPTGQNLRCASYFGGTGREAVNEFSGGIAATATGSICLVGTTNSTTLPVYTTTGGTYQQAFNGNLEMFLLQVCSLCANPSVSVTAPPAAICPGDSVELTASEVQGAILWSGGQTTNTIRVAPTATTTYTVTATLGNCSASQDVTVTVRPVLLANAGNDTAIACNGNADLLAAASGGSGGPFTYEWTGGPATANYNDRGLGTYYVTIRDVAGCTDVDSVKVTAAVSTLALTLTSSQSSICTGQSTVLTTNVTGGTGVKTYAWSNDASGLSGAGPHTITPGSAGAKTYTLNVTDADGCSVSKSVNLTVNQSKDASFQYSAGTYCQSGSDPTPSITDATGIFSSTPAGLSINTSTGMIDLDASALGTFTVSYAVAGACGDTKTASITITNAPGANFSYAAASYCPDDADPSPNFPMGSSAGTFSAIPAGLVFVSTSTGQIDLSASTPGTYSVSNNIAAAGGCAAASHTSSLTINTPKTASFSYPTTTYCKSGADANASITGTTGGSFSATPAGLVIDVSSGTVDLSASAVGTYTIMYSVPGPCGDSKTQTLTINNAPGTTFNYSASAYCADGLDPLPNYPVGNQAGNFSAIPAGLLFANLATGKIDLSASTAGTYDITNTIPAGSGPGGCSSSSHTVSITINSNPQLTNTVTSQSICSGSATSINLTASEAGSSFSWTATGPASITGYSNSSGSFINQVLTTTAASSGIVTYRITPAKNGCSGISQNFTVAVDPIPQVINSVLDTTICSAGTTLINLWSDVSTATFSWTAAGQPGVNGYSTGSGNQIVETLTNSAVAAATVTYTVSPSSGSCVGNPVDFTVTVDPIPVVSVAPASSAICSADATNIYLSSSVSGSTISWNAGASSAQVTGYTPSGTGTNIVDVLHNTTTTDESVTYTVLAKAGECTSIPVSSVVTVHPIPEVMATPITQSICSEQAAMINIAGTVSGSAFAWTTAATAGLSGFANGTGDLIHQVLTNTTASIGTVSYSITATANNCSGSVVYVSVDVKPLPVLLTRPSNGSGGPDTTICIDTKAVLEVSGADNYNWTPPEKLEQSIGHRVQTIPLAEGLHTFSVSGTKDGCSNSTNMVVMVLDTIPPPEVSGSQHVCKGEAVRLIATTKISPASFAWYRDSNMTEIIIQQATLLTDPLYSDDTTFYTNILYGSCASGLTPFYIQIRTLPQIVVTGLPVVCKGDKLQVTASGGSDYRWYTQSGDTVSINPLLDVSPEVDQSWYYVQVKDSACVSIDSIQVKVNPLPPIDPGPSVDLCLGGFQRIGTPAEPGLSYLWQPSSQLNKTTIAQPSFKASEIGKINYTLTATNDVTQCRQSKSLQVEVHELPQAQIILPEDYAKGYCAGSKLTLKGIGAIGSADVYDWYPQNGSTISGQEVVVELSKNELSYTLIITTDKGCKGQREVLLKGEDCNDVQVHVPTIFSPNEDLLNDRLEISYGAGIIHANLRVFDRWGALVYQGTKDSSAWDGVNGTHVLPEGVYVYLLEVRSTGGKSYQTQGVITLSR